MDFVVQGDSIECLSADVISRDIRHCSYVDIRDIGKCKTYKCKKNSEATITQELSPKKHKNKEESHLNNSDRIMGKNIFFAVENKKNIKIEVINFTSTHKAQKTSTNCYTFAEVSLPHPNIPVRKQIK